MPDVPGHGARRVSGAHEKIKPRRTKDRRTRVLADHEALKGREPFVRIGQDSINENR